MKRLVAVTALLAVVALAGCSSSSAKRSTMTEGPFRCTAKDSFGNSWSWTAYHKELAMTNAFDICRYRSQDIASCAVSISDCAPISQIPDKLNALSDFRGGQ